MPWVKGKYVKAESLLPNDQTVEMTYAGYVKLRPHAKGFFDDFSMQDIFEYRDMSDLKPDIIYKRRAGESAADLKKRIDNFEEFIPYLYQRMLKTVPESFLMELEQINNGLAAWIKFTTHLTEKNYNFISTTQDRLKGMELSHYDNNMRLFLIDFKRDLNILKDVETFSATALLKALRKAQAISDERWNIHDPYHEPLASLFEKVADGQDISFDDMQLKLEQHYDLVFKNKVENIHGNVASRVPKMEASKKGPEKLNITKDITIDKNTSVKSMVDSLSKVPGLSKSKCNQVKQLQAHFSTKGGGKGGGKGKGNDRRSIYKGRKGGKGGKGNRGKGKGNKTTFYCHNCKKPGHYAKDCWAPGGGAQKPSTQNGEQANVVEIAFVASQLEPVALNATDPALHDNDYIYIDTCASCHMTGSDKGVSEKVEFSSNVQFGDPLTTSEVTHKCKKRLPMIDQYKTKFGITLKDTLFVPGLSKTLISVKKLADQGVNIQLTPGNLRMIVKQPDGKRSFIPMTWHNNLLAIKLQPFQ